MEARVSHRQSAIEIMIDGRRFRAITTVVMRGGEPFLIDSCNLMPMPPRQSGLIDRSAEDAEIIT